MDGEERPSMGKTRQMAANTAKCKPELVSIADLLSGEVRVLWEGRSGQVSEASGHGASVMHGKDSSSGSRRNRARGNRCLQYSTLSCEGDGKRRGGRAIQCKSWLAG